LLITGGQTPARAQWQHCLALDAMMPLNLQLRWLKTIKNYKNEFEFSKTLPLE